MTITIIIIIIIIVVIAVIAVIVIIIIIVVIVMSSASPGCLRRSRAAEELSAKRLSKKKLLRAVYWQSLERKLLTRSFLRIIVTRNYENAALINHTVH